MQLICAFVFIYAKSRISYDVAQLMIKAMRKCVLCHAYNKGTDQPTHVPRHEKTGFLHMH